MVVDPFISFTIAVFILIFGKILHINIYFLQKYSIPEPVAGGFVCVIFVAVIYFTTGMEIEFSLGLRDFLLLVFFAGIGLRSSIASLISGGKPLLVLLFLASIFIVIQNFTGMGIAGLFGLDPKAGLMSGSVSLTGGVGTTVAWAPIFVEKLGIANASELGLASNTIGLIAACCIGGPIAAFLIKKRNIQVSGNPQLDVGATNDAAPQKLDYFCVLWAIFAINLAIMLGLAFDALIKELNITLPTFVSCLVAGIIIRNITPFTGRAITRVWPGTNDALTLVMDISLGLFLTMALMGLQLWTLAGMVDYIVTVLAVQIILTILFVIYIVFPAMGRDYEAVVMSAGFGGISLGSTATAIANMTAVTQQYGAARQAFIVVPLVCGFFIDIVNSLIVSAFVG